MGLEYKCLQGMIKPSIHIDEFASKMGDNDDVSVASFYVTDEQAAKDLVGWFEKGYEFVLDADRSPGEISPNHYLVYVEMKRRSNLGTNITTMLEDLSTLCEYSSKEWTFTYGKDKMEFTTENFEQVVPTSPKAYRLDKELGLNEMRAIAGLKAVSTYENTPDIQAMKDIAGIK